LTATLLPALRATGGHVVLVNSAPGLRGVPGWSGYLGSKSVLRVLADSLRVEEPALRVTTVYPGAVATDLLREVRHARGQEYDPDRAVGVRSPARSHRLRHRSRSRAPHPGRRTSSTLPGRGRTPHRCHPPRSRSQRPPRLGDRVRIGDPHELAVVLARETLGDLPPGFVRGNLPGWCAQGVCRSSVAQRADNAHYV